MFTERIAIREEMAWIRDEIRNLKERYWFLSKRLSELDKSEKEAIDVESVMKELNNVVKLLSGMIPTLTVNDVIRGLKNETPDIEEIIETNITEKVTIKTGDIEIAKEREDKNKSVRTRKYQDLKSQVPLVVGILKEVGMPIKPSMIANRMKELYNIEWNNPSQCLYYISEHEPRIKKATRGFYQYI